MSKPRLPNAQMARKKAVKSLKTMRSLRDVVGLINSHIALGFTNAGGYVAVDAAKEAKVFLEKKGYKVYLINQNLPIWDIEVEW
jgi:hypothetical protein